MKLAKDKQVSKKAIIIARVILVLLIVIVILITYLRFFGINPNLEEHPVNKSDNSQDEFQIKLLELIVTNFNNNSLLEDYKKQNISMEATVNSDNSIIISYVGEDTKKYEFDYVHPNIEILINEDEKEDFYKVYKLLIEANQIRLENRDNYDEYIDEFLVNDRNIDGLIKEIQDDGSIKFVMDVSKIIVEMENNNIEGSD